MGDESARQILRNLLVKAMDHGPQVFELGTEESRALIVLLGMSKVDPTDPNNEGRN